MNLTSETCKYCGFAGVYLHSRECRDIYSASDQWRVTDVYLQCSLCRIVYYGWTENTRDIDGPRNQTVVYKNRLISRRK